MRKQGEISVKTKYCNNFFFQPCLKLTQTFAELPEIMQYVYFQELESGIRRLKGIEGKRGEISAKTKCCYV